MQRIGEGMGRLGQVWGKEQVRIVRGDCWVDCVEEESGIRK